LGREKKEIMGRTPPKKKGGTGCGWGEKPEKRKEKIRGCEGQEKQVNKKKSRHRGGSEIKNKKGGRGGGGVTSHGWDFQGEKETPQWGWKRERRAWARTICRKDFFKREARKKGKKQFGRGGKTNVWGERVAWGLRGGIRAKRGTVGGGP